MLTAVSVLGAETTRASGRGRNARTQWQTRQWSGWLSASTEVPPMRWAAGCATAMAAHASWQSSSCGTTAEPPTAAIESMATVAIVDARVRNHCSI